MISKNPESSKISWLLPVLSLIWLAIALWAAHGQIRSNSGGAIALATAADALPGVVQATAVAGIGLALLIAAWLLRSAANWLRWVAGAVAGAIAGGAAAVATTVAYPHLPSIDAIAITLVVAGVLGGVLTAVPRIQPAVRGGLGAALGALAMITIVNANAVLSRLLNLYGFGSSPAADLQASKYVQYTEYVLAGIAAGLIAFMLLRRSRSRQAPMYVLAGAFPGILLLVAFGLTSIGGHDLLSAANGLSEADRILNGAEAAETVPNALIVLFIGALVALIAFGRTLEPRAAKAPATSSTLTDQSGKFGPTGKSGPSGKSVPSGKSAASGKSAVAGKSEPTAKSGAGNQRGAADRTVRPTKPATTGRTD